MKHTPDSAAQTYKLLDFGGGRRLEQWGPFLLVRPDPTALGLPVHPEFWSRADATYLGEKGQGKWVSAGTMPEHWPVQFDDLSLFARLAPYKHTGVFPEQQGNWRWARETARRQEKKLTVLNLFAYTGGATVALAKDGHFVTHVDAARPSIGWAKENASLNDLPSDAIRWILEDASVFAARELKRGKKYDAVILDPPAYGHGPSGKTWRVERDLLPLLRDCFALLSDQPSFLLLNGYAHQDSSESIGRLLGNTLRSVLPRAQVKIDTRELILVAADRRPLSTGVVGRCVFVV